MLLNQNFVPRYLIIGGDERMLELANIFKNNSYDISTFGFDFPCNDSINSYKDLESAIDNSDIIIGPIPFASQDNILNAKYTSRIISIPDLIKQIKKGKILLGGSISSNIREILDNNNTRYFDYNQDEEFQIKNAIATAEGAVAIIINETDKTLYNSNVMVLGYGRIGKILCNYLKALGANVYAEARKEVDLDWIDVNRLRPVKISDLENYLSNMNIIINTIPSLILDENRLYLIQKDTLILDLASKPGGVDFAYCKSNGIKTIHALGLPGKIAYKTSSEIIFNTIRKLINNI